MPENDSADSTDCREGIDDDDDGIHRAVAGSRPAPANRERRCSSERAPRGFHRERPIESGSISPHVDIRPASEQDAAVDIDRSIVTPVAIPERAGDIRSPGRAELHIQRSIRKRLERGPVAVAANAMNRADEQDLSPGQSEHPEIRAGARFDPGLTIPFPPNVLSMFIARPPRDNTHSHRPLRTAGFAGDPGSAGRRRGTRPGRTPIPMICDCRSRMNRGYLFRD